MPFMGFPFMGIDFFTLITTVFWVWMLVDCLLNRNMRGSKICWFLLILFTQWIGALIYFFTACRQRNPLNALAYYWQTIAGATTFQNPVRPNMPPPLQWSRSQAQPAKTPPDAVNPTYPHYAQGYQPRPTTFSPTQSADTPFYQGESQAEYEQPTISYPEMPQQQQQP
jgi:hypothetical protein